MNTKILIFLAAASFNVQAQNCGDIPDGTVSRLDSPGRSLANSHVQDQDGLGTCYANTASLMLQSVMPNNPDVSYLQLSLNHAENLVQKELRSQGKSQAFRDNGDLLIEAGFSCDTIKLAKETGGFCERKNVALEQMLFRTDINQFSDPNRMQMDLLKRVSNYYDGMLKDFSSSRKTADNNQSPPIPAQTGEAVPVPAPVPAPVPTPAAPKRSFFQRLFGIEDRTPAPVVDKTPKGVTLTSATDKPKLSPPPSNEEKNEKFAQYKKLLEKTIEENRDKYAQRKCGSIDTTNSMKVTQNLLMKMYNNINAKKYKKFPEVRYKLFQIRMGSAYDIRVNGVPVVESKIDERVKKALEDVYLKQLSNSKPQSALVAYRDMLYKIDPNTPKKLIDELVANISNDDKELLNQDYKRYVQKDYSSCESSGKLAYLANEDGLLKDFVGSGCSSDFIKHVKNLQQMVVGLDKYNFNNIDRLNDFISNLPNVAYDKAMMQLFAPDCSDDKKIQIPRNVSCSAKAFGYPGTKDDDAQTTERNLTSMRRSFAGDTLKSINDNKAVGLSMCTGFYEKSSPNEFYNKSGICDKTKKHGFHAVTMIGYKCTAGKLKYLIQNSWGSWDTANGRFEKDSHGKAWMEEDELVKNTYQLDVMN